MTQFKSCTCGKVQDEGENAAVLRSKGSLQTSGKLIGAAIKQRAALGDICKNRTAQTNNIVVKADSSENDFKKPILLPAKSISIKNSIHDSEKYVVIALLVRKIKTESSCVSLSQLSSENNAPVAVETERPRSFSSQNLNVEEIDTESNPQLVAVYVKDIYVYLHELEVLFNWIYCFAAYNIIPCKFLIGENNHQAQLYGRLQNQTNYAYDSYRLDGGSSRSFQIASRNFVFDRRHNGSFPSGDFLLQDLIFYYLYFLFQNFRLSLK